MKTLKAYRSGTIKIVSSGYGDRYALSTVWFVIEKNGVKYRIDNDDDRVAALLELSGIEYQTATEEQLSSAIHTIVSSPMTLTSFYKNGNTRGSVKTTTDRINAGIKMATGYLGLNEHGINSEKKIAETLIDIEWLVIRTGLERINKIHAETGRPVVEFNIPAAK